MTDMHPTEVQTWIADHDPLQVVAFPDEVIETHGHHPSSEYAETFWLPVLGPSAMWALRRLVGWLEESPEGFPLPLAPLARELGLGPNTSRSSQVVHTLTRLVTFGMAHVWGDTFAVRLAVPPLAQRHLRRLPPHLVERHRQEGDGRHTETDDVIPLRT